MYFGMDNKLKTPYSNAIDFSVGRELGRDFALQVSYVGRLSHRLFSQMDVATPLDLVDPNSEMDYYTAVTALAKLYRTVPSEGVTAQQVGPAAILAERAGNRLPRAVRTRFPLSRCANLPLRQGPAGCLQPVFLLRQQ